MLYLVIKSITSHFNQYLVQWCSVPLTDHCLNEDILLVFNKTCKLEHFFFKSLYFVSSFFVFFFLRFKYNRLHIYMEKVKQNKIQQKKVGERILFIGLHMELSDHLYLCCIKETYKRLPG